MRRFLSPSFAIALAALVASLGGTAIAAGTISGSDEPETVLRMRVTKDGKAIGTHNDGTVKKAGVGIYEITFSTGPTGGKLPLDLDVQRLDGARIFVESTRPVPFSNNKITPFLTNVSFDVAAIC